MLKSIRGSALRHALGRFSQFIQFFRSPGVKKILSPSEAILQCRDWKRNGRRIVLVSGHFALLHPGHIRLLEQARSYGDLLLVLLASDASSAAGNQSLESLAPLAERAEILAALAAVDFVTNYDGPSPEPLAAKLSPDVIVTGADSSSASLAGQATLSAKSPGAQIVRLPLEPGYSTKLLLERIAQLPA
jgi:rfaE bifunctional protein nucleotidyltransferase chain/domain